MVKTKGRERGRKRERERSREKERKRERKREREKERKREREKERKRGRSSGKWLLDYCLCFVCLLGLIVWQQGNVFLHVVCRDSVVLFFGFFFLCAMAKAAVDAFLACDRFVVVGASTNRDKFGNKVLRALLSKFGADRVLPSMVDGAFDRTSMC